MSDSETASNQCNTAALGKVPGIQKVPTPRMELYILRNFLTPEECARFVEKIDADRRPSPIPMATIISAPPKPATCAPTIPRLSRSTSG